MVFALLGSRDKGPQPGGLKQQECVFTLVGSWKSEIWKAPPAGPCVFPHVLRKDASRILPSFQGLQQPLVVLVGVLLQPLPLSS